MEDTVDFLPLILLLVLAAFAFILLKPLKQIIRLRRVPTLPIAALPSSGQVEVIGRAGGNVVRSPISDTVCVLWHVEVQEYRGSGPTGRWRTIRTQTSSQPIELTDDTGHIWVVPTGAELVLGNDLRATRDALHTLSPQFEAALERMGIPLRSAFRTWRFLRVREQRIVPGEPIFVLGLLEEAAGQLRLCSTQDAPLLLADRSKHEVLRRLYREVGVSVFCAVVALGFIGWLMAGGRL
jgi:hypothetical protein